MNDKLTVDVTQNTKYSEIFYVKHFEYISLPHTKMSLLMTSVTASGINSHVISSFVVFSFAP